MLKEVSLSYYAKKWRRLCGTHCELGLCGTRCEPGFCGNRCEPRFCGTRSEQYVPVVQRERHVQCRRDISYKT